MISNALDSCSFTKTTVIIYIANWSLGLPTTSRAATLVVCALCQLFSNGNRNKL